MPHCQLFVDDSGNREYDDDKQYGPDGKSRHFVYGGILLQEREAQLFTTRLRELKKVYFGTAAVEVKSNWLRIPKEQQKYYLQPYNLTPEKLKQFTDDYYALINQATVELIGAIVDKLHMQETYGGNAWYAPTVAYDVLLQRAVQAVTAGDTLSVIVDDISGKTPRKNDYKELLADHHDTLIARGSKLQPTISFKCLKGAVRFVNSARSDLLQAADLISYNVHRQFRDYGEEWENIGAGPRDLPMYPHFERISRKFRCDANRRVQGYGIVKFPLRQRVYWRVTDEREKPKQEG